MTELQSINQIMRKLIDVDELPREALALFGTFVGNWTLGLPSPMLRTGIKKRFNKIRRDDMVCSTYLDFPSNSKDLND